MCIITEESVKYCAEDGNWFEKAGLQWTDYTPCVDKQVGSYAHLYRVAHNKRNFIHFHSLAS